jgi:hypothetical protein
VQVGKSIVCEQRVLSAHFAIFGEFAESRFAVSMRGLHASSAFQIRRQAWLTRGKGVSRSEPQNQCDGAGKMPPSRSVTH